MPTLEVKVPAVGDFKDIPIIEVHVKPGDSVAPEDPLVTLESEKATMDVPSPAAGTVKELKVKLGDRVSEGSVVLTLDATEGAPAKPPAGGNGAERGADGAQRAAEAAPLGREIESAAAPAPAPLPAEAPVAKPPTGAPPVAPAPVARSIEVLSARPAAEGAPPPRVAHASPSVRRFARELGVDLGRVDGSGPHGRIVRDDVQRFVKDVVGGAAPAGAGAGLGLLPWPKVDFAKFGPVETRPLTRIQKISGPALARNWVMIPHVTQFDEADITALEEFRVALGEEQAKAGGVKVTLLAFVVKACVAALRRFPEVNASLDGDRLVLKRYFHIGFAADTPNGLVVPVVRNADQKGVLEIARELAELAAKAREGKLAPADLQGGSFSISSLGGIGGTAFTPIINAPEVAILGVSRSQTKPVWDGERFAPRLVLPLSLSYDHRVVDGALAARFTSHLAQVLADMRRAML
jgi:pyruvate dehydrogenase E2 component (dihydrolipoamide acetyltransferase)